MYIDIQPAGAFPVRAGLQIKTIYPEKTQVALERGES
jgi:hypothetical protein